MAVPTEIEPSFVAGTPRRLVEARYFRGGPFRSYDVSPDGTRFLMITRGDAAADEAPSPTIVIVQHWFEELKRLALP